MPATNQVGRRTPVAHFWFQHVSESPLTVPGKSVYLAVPYHPLQEEKAIYQYSRNLGGLLRASFSLRGLHPLACAALLAATAGVAAEPVEGLVVPFRQVEVSSPVSSFIVDVQAKEGDRVKAGQPLAQLYGKLDELELRRAKAILERREFEAQGVKRLYDSRILPEAKALEARIELDLARLNVETATEQVRLRTILAPIDGLVVERCREAGEAVQAYQRIFRIVDLSKVYIVCAWKPERLAQVAVGQRRSVGFPEWQAAPSLLAEVVYLDPCVDAAGLIRMKLLLDNPEGRLHGGQKALVEDPAAEVRPGLPEPVRTP